MPVAELCINILNDSFDCSNFDYLRVATYKCGETIKGSVIVKVVSPGLCIHDGIVLIIEGAGEFRWTGQNEEISHKNKYLSIETLLTREDLPVGYHEFPFQFTLPNDLPSSFFSSETTAELHHYGEVFYEIRAIMKRSFKFNPEASVQFQVNGVLNDMPLGCSVPLNTLTMKNIKTASGNISVVLNCPLKEFTPGGCLQFTTSFYNNSLKRILSTTVNFVQCTRYYGMDGNLQNLQVKKIFSLNGLSVEIGKVDVLAAQEQILDIPPPLSKSKGRILEISYYFLMSVNVLDCDKPLKVMIPVFSDVDPEKLYPTSKFAYSGVQAAVVLKQR